MITEYPTTYDISRPGQVHDAGIKKVITRNNDAGRTAQVDTLTVDSVVNSTAYTMDINGVTIAPAATDASATTTELAVLFKNAINVEELVNGTVVATNAAAVLTITARIAGVGFSTTNVPSVTTLVLTTANATATEVAFGACLIQASATSYDDTSVASAAASMTAKVLTVTPTAVNSVLYGLGVRVNGSEYNGWYTSDGSATVAEITAGLIAPLNANLPANTVIAADGTTNITLTAEIAGLDFEAVVHTTSTATAVIAHTTDTKISRLMDCVEGVAVQDLTQGGDDDGDNNYPGSTAMGVLQYGVIGVLVGDADPNRDLPVYIGVGSSHVGLWRTTASGANYIIADPAKFSWVAGGGTYDTGYLGILRVNL